MYRLAALTSLLVFACDSPDDASVDGAVPTDAIAPIADRAVDAEPTDVEPTDAESPDAAPRDAVAADGLPPAPPAWPDAGPAPSIDHPLADAHPAAFARLSRWSAQFEVPGPRTSARGAFAVGNGRVFSISGLIDPATTLHNIAGPTYDRDGGFFGDQSVMLADGPFDSISIAQSLSAPIVITRGCRGGTCLDVIDFAPVDTPCIVRHLRVSGGATDVVIEARPSVEPTPDGLIERRGVRTLITRLPAAAVDGATLRRSFEDGEMAMASLCMAIGELHPGVGDLDPGVALDALAAWTAAPDRATLEGPDDRVVDFVEGVARALAVQTGRYGAVSPMHRYTRLWLRDSIGPTLAWLHLGEHDRVAALLDTLDAEIRRAGDLRNSMAADRDPESAPDAPDYAALPPLGGRTAAEGPSYLVRMHWLYWMHTGDLERARQAMPLLRRALLAQGFEADDQLPFSGDETFRIAMSAALDLPLDHPHEELSWSANSLMLWMGAARQLADLARATGEDDLIPLIADRRDRVERTLSRYIDPDGCIGAFIDRASGTLSAPFEDVSLKATWSGWLPDDDPRAIANIACLVDRIGIAPGVLQSPLAPPYVGLPVLAGGPGSGIFTGMQPAFTLSALAAVDHPWAPHAFHALGAALLPDGMPQEYQVRGDAGPFGLTLLYDPTGLDADQTPKLRPWEGGIALAAVVDYLLGFAPDAPNAALTLNPRLPHGWPGHRWRNLRVGPVQVAIDVDGDRVQVSANGPLDVTVGGTTRAVGSGSAVVFDLPE